MPFSHAHRDGTLQRPCSASDLIADRDELLAQLDDLEEVLRAARLDKLYHARGASGDASTGADQAIKTVKDDLKETKKDIRLMAGAAKAALVVLRRGFSQRRGGPGDRKQTPRGRAGNGRVVATAMVVDR